MAPEGRVPRAFGLSAILCLGASCSREPASRPDAGPAAAATPILALVADGGSSAPAGELDAGAFELPLGVLKVVSAKAIGHTSVVFKIRVEGQGGLQTFAFKPRSKRGGVRYRAEVAAWGLAELLGIAARVPKARIVRLSRGDLAHALVADPRGSGLLQSEMVTDEAIFGAAVPWVDDLGFLPVEKGDLRQKWHDWLGASPPQTPDDRKTASALAEMFIFDALTGNWDRMSGENVGVDKKRDEVLFVDNDAAFFEPLSPRLKDASWRPFRQVRQYPRAMVERLRSFDIASLREELVTLQGEEGAPLLSAAQLGAVDLRRKALLAEIDQNIASGTAHFLTQ